MSIILYGVTEDGTSVPVQLTRDGKLVVQADDSFAGDIDCDSITAAGDISNYHSTDKKGVYIGQDGYVTVNHTSRGGLSAFSIQSTSGGVTSEPFQINGSGNVSIGGIIDTAPNIELKNDGSITAISNLQTGENSGSVNQNKNGTIVGANGFIDIYKDSNNTSDFLGGRKTGSVEPRFSIAADGSATFAGHTCGFTPAGELFFTSRGSRYKAVVQGGNLAAEPYTRANELQERRRPRTQDIVPED